MLPAQGEPTHGESMSCAPVSGDDWLGLLDESLPVNTVGEWLVRPDCGAIVVFTGTARDHSEGRRGVHLLTYEAYEDYAAPRLAAVASEARDRWPGLARLAVLHRVGDVSLGEAAVVVGASSAHRDEAFAAARYCIDAVKATVPIWKRERWEGGEGWGLDGAALVDAARVRSPRMYSEHEATT